MTPSEALAVLCVGPRTLGNTCETARELLARELRALADMRTLDASSRIRYAIVDYTGKDGPDRYRCEVGTQGAFEGATPDEARAKAAAYVEADRLNA